jgi:general secretion pathway protein D
MIGTALLLLLCFGSALCLPIAAAEEAAGGQISLDFRDVELVDLIKTISEMTGKNFLYDESVKGKVTIISPETMSLDEAYQLFLTVLNVRGYTLVPSGKVNKIVQIKNATQENLPVYSGRMAASDQFITRMVRLQYLDVETIANSVLGPLMPSTGNIIAYPPTNVLIMTETAATIERLVRIVEQLDLPQSEGELTLFKLKHAEASEVATICQEMLLQKSTSNVSKSKQVSTSAAVSSKIVAYSRTNSLIVRATPEELEQIRGLIAEIDQEVMTGGERSGIHVYYLENADAKTLSTTLNEIVSGIQVQAKTAQSSSKGSEITQAMTSGSVTVTADIPTNALIINSPPNDYVVLQEVIKKLDIKRKQVYIEALILELSMDASEELGASLQGAVDTGDGYSYWSTNQNSSDSTSLSSFLSTDDDGNASILSQAVSGVLLGGMFGTVDTDYGAIPALSILLNLSETNENVNVLSAPRLLTMNNQEAEIIVGENVPVISAATVDGDDDDTTYSVDREDAALTLRFTPQVIEDNLVQLTIFQEVTAVVDGTSDNTYGPDITVRSISNTVLAENGKTIVLGGLISSTVTDSETKVPFLGDIPILGWLFKSTSSSEDKSNLLIFITPTIINSAEDLATVTAKNKRKANSYLTDAHRALLTDEFEFIGGEVDSSFFQTDTTAAE